MKSIRLKKAEEDTLKQRYIEINKVLINSNREPLTESELLHLIIEMGLKRAEVGKDKPVTII